MSEFFDSLDRSRGRDIVVNWEEELQRIADSYPLGIPHGVQKDAVQNGWDARLDKSGKDWEFSFELCTPPGQTFLTMTDAGTYGLTGRVLSDDELTQDLPPEERWGRFENLAFTKDPSEEALGARGQGKFIFVAASQKRRILYDTLRADGVYRFGVRIVENRTENRSWYWDGEEAEAQLAAYCPDLRPLGRIGTRVIIDDPVEDLLTDIAQGRFLAHIQDTWWQIIEKHDAAILVKQGTTTRKAKVPQERQLAGGDSATSKVWLRENDRLPADGSNYRVKRLHVEHVKGRAVSDSLRGVAVQRGGMKICNAEWRHGVPRDVAQAIVGYIEFDKQLDLEMKRFEDPTHYAFIWRKGAPRAVRQYIDDQLEKFGREKLGVGVSSETQRRHQQSEAERRALRFANGIARQLGIYALGLGVDPPNPPGGTRQATRPIRLVMPPPEYPRQGLRVELGEAISGVTCKAANDTERSLRVRIKGYVVCGDKVVEELGSHDALLQSTGEWNGFETKTIQLAEPRYSQKGRHSIRFAMTALEKIDAERRKGYKLDEVSRAFYLGEDPPQGGIFEKMVNMDFTDNYVKLRGDIEQGEGRGWIYKYNGRHGEYRVAADNTDTLTEYLARLLVEAIFEIDLRQPTPQLFTKDDLDSPLRVAQVIAERTAEVMFDYYGGADRGSRG